MTKEVLNLRRIYEESYPQGYFITKRGEEAPLSKDKNYVIDLAELGKYMMSWHSKRPNQAYSETKLFDKYFEQLFKRDYNSEDIRALKFWMNHIMKCWTQENPLNLNESLLAMKAYAPYHHLYAISQFFAIHNNQIERVPKPSASYNNAEKFGAIDEIVNISALSINVALETGSQRRSTI